MREILFKGRSLLSGEWVEGYYIGPIGVLDVHEICDVHDITGPRVEVDPSTVCQYTGLKDKNGKRIFDGDVVRRETDYYGKHKVYDEPVVWEDDIEKGFLGEPYTSGYCIHGGNWEVIGSIHDGEGGNHA